MSTGDRIQAETTLKRNGIDPEALKQDFVSHQAIHTYLTKHRSVEHPAKRTGPDRIETADDTIQRR